MTIMTRRKAIATMGGALGMLLAACSTEAPVSDTAAEAADGAIRITYVDISASEVTSAQGSAMKAYAEANGAELTVEYFDQNVSTEQALIENAIQAGVSALIVHSQGAEDCVDALNAAVDAGIPVLLYQTDVPNVRYTVMYTEDGYESGQMEGRMAAAWAQENLVDKGIPVVVASGTYSVSPFAAERSQGARDAFLEAIPDARLVGTYEAAYKEEGLEVGENLLISDPDTNVFLGVNDQSAAGVMEAFQAAGHTQDVGLFGIDGTDQGMYDIARGTLFKGTVAIPYAQVGEDLVQAALDLCTGTSAYEPGGQTIEYWESAAIDESNVEDYRDIWGHLE